MARNGNPAPNKHFGLLTGTALICIGLFVAVALITFDAGDLGFLREPPQNSPAKNYGGMIGAFLGFALLFIFGLSAYLVPIGLIAIGLGMMIEQLTSLQRRWPWMLVFFVTLSILLRHIELIFPHLTRELAQPLRINSIGGLAGYLAYEYGFWLVGKVGIWIVCGMLMGISLLYLSDFRLRDWINQAAKIIKNRWLGLQNSSVFTGEIQSDEIKDKTPPKETKPSITPRIRDTCIPEAPKTSPKQTLEASTSTEESASQSEAKTEKGGLSRPEPGPTTTESTAQTLSPIGQAPSISLPNAETKPAQPTQSTKKTKRAATITPLVTGNYQLPPIDLLNPPPTLSRPSETKEELLANAKRIQQTLAEFGIEVAVGDITRGPTITRYELHPAPGVKLERIASLSNNIAATLQAESVHILAPIPGKSSVGVEVPNRVKTYVYLRDLLESEEWRNTRAKIPIALGKDVYGNPIIADLAEMPHMLIAGSTGSGKSVCVNAIVTSLLYRFPPDQLRFVMIDPKVVELQQYNALPHLVVPVITDPKKVILALRWVINEMEKRYQIFARVGVRNIQAFNERPKTQPIKEKQPELPLTTKRERIEPTADGFAVQIDEEITVQEEDDLVIPEKLTYIVVIIDELADLMLVAPRDVETHIARITQMARAAGIHCIIATQRPSVDVITGVIKANIAARIAFQCASAVDSRTILDVKGAEKLIGKGDMLFQPPGASKLIRAQGALVTDAEIQRVVQFICKQAKPNYELEIHQALQQSTPQESDDQIQEDEELIQKCIDVILTEQKASVSLLQRRLRLGYTRAARIMDELERRGIVGPSKGAEPRDILISRPTKPQPPIEPPPQNSESE